MLMPLVMPPKQAESMLPRPSRTSSRLPSVFGAPAALRAWRRGARRARRQRPARRHRRRSTAGVRSSRALRPGRERARAGPTFRRAGHADDRTEVRPESGRCKAEIEHGADADADQERRDFRCDRACIPHHGKGDQCDGEAQGLHLRQMRGHPGERDALIEAAHVAQLDEKEESRCRVLQTGHDRMRRESQQRAKAHGAEQGLEGAAEKNDRKEGENGRVQAAVAQAFRVARSGCGAARRGRTWWSRAGRRPSWCGRRGRPRRCRPGPLHTVGQRAMAK